MQLLVLLAISVCIINILKAFISVKHICFLNWFSFQQYQLFKNWSLNCLGNVRFQDAVKGMKSKSIRKVDRGGLIENVRFSIRLL